MYGNDEYTEQTYDSYGYGVDYHDSHSGVASSDMEYYKVPEVVKQFLIYFRNCINEGLIYEIQNLYETTFPKLTEEFFEKSSWPDENEIAHFVDNDSLFLILYKELYYRHIYAKISGGPTLEHRFASFFNYCDLFNYILSAEQPVHLELPDQWLWELVDEFVYQFQTFSQYRARLLQKSQDELETLNSNNKVWNVLWVLNVLHSLVDKSNIKRQLEVFASGGDPDSVAGEFGRHSLYKMLGYFSLVGLLRLHSLLGDYYQAIKVLENIELHKKSQYSHVPGCQISTSYYVGFAYMMMRRYSDAIRTFSSILLYIQRTKQLFQSRTYQNDQINKQTDQMYNLLAICLVLHPQCVDESIQQVLRDKNYHEKIYKMQCGDLEEFESCFMMACPKFLSPAPPPIDSPKSDEYVKEAIKHQTKVFMDEVRQQKMLPIIRSRFQVLCTCSDSSELTSKEHLSALTSVPSSIISMKFDTIIKASVYIKSLMLHYLKLYTTLPLSKLANFMSQGQEQPRNQEQEIQALTIHLLCFKHKMKNVVWTKGTSGLEGKFQSGSELDFYIDHDMIHIADTKVAHRYGDFFIRKILKFEDVNRKLHNIKI